MGLMLRSFTCLLALGYGASSLFSVLAAFCALTESALADQFAVKCVGLLRRFSQ